MTRPRLAPGAAGSPNVTQDSGESKPVDSQGRSPSPDGRATPESKAKKVLKLERARQQTEIRRMDAVQRKMNLTTAVLTELLSDPAFVALLCAEGLRSIPELVRRRLTERPR